MRRSSRHIIMHDPQLGGYLEPRETYRIRDNHFGPRNTHRPDAFPALLANRNATLGADLHERIRGFLQDDMKDFCQLRFDMNETGTSKMMLLSDRYNDGNGTLKKVKKKLSEAFPNEIQFTTPPFPDRNEIRRESRPFLFLHPKDEYSIPIPITEDEFTVEHVSPALGVEIILFLKDTYESGQIIDPYEHMNTLPDFPVAPGFKAFTMNFLVPVTSRRGKQTQTTLEDAVEQRRRLNPPDPESRKNLVQIGYFPRTLE